jgi:Cu-Zn family superoxide dismutase
MRRLLAIFTAAAAVTAAPVAAAPVGVHAKQLTMYAHMRDRQGESVGTVRLVEVAGGTQMSISVDGLPQGKHGFHIHAGTVCGPSADKATGKTVAFGAAGKHFDPMATNKHRGPDGGGHAGDLPNIDVDADGQGALTYFDKNVTLSPGPRSIAGKAIVIHAKEDNYTDAPPVGGSGARIACGIVEAKESP